MSVTASATRCSFAAACRSIRSRRQARRWRHGRSGSASASTCSPPSRRSGCSRPRRAVSGRIGEGALRFGRLCETYPDAVFCSLIGHRPPPKRTPWGLQQRIAALRLRGVVDADGGLWHRTLDELDACAAAYAAYVLASGGGSWVGDPREGVIVLPVEELLPRYDPPPPPARAPLA